MSKRRYSVEENGQVVVKFKDGGRIESDSVEALLLYEILKRLEDGKGPSVTERK